MPRAVHHSVLGRVFMVPMACALAVATAGCGANSGDAPGTSTSTVSSPGTASDASTGAGPAPVDASDLNIDVLMELRPTENRAISVSCPEDLRPEVGATVTCEVEALNGKQLKVTVTAMNVTGDTVDYEITDIA